MKVKNIRVFIIIVCAVFILINIIEIVCNNNIFNYIVEAKIENPIIIIEKDDIIESKIDETSFPIEYNFYISNYYGDNVNEVECKYNIELENSVQNFPVTYILIDCNNNKEVVLKDGKSENLKIAKGKKESRQFRLIVKWQELNVELDNELDIKLKINVVQEIEK